MKYKGEYTREISFPLGGIGSGSIGLSGNGRLIDWEIKNRPDKGSVNGFSHFAVKAEANGKMLDARVLNGDLPESYMGQFGKSYGFGPLIETMAGFPHFKDTEFVGEFPFATLHFSDVKFPGKVSLTAFNPFIPLNEKDSSIPGAFFEVEFENNQENDIDYSIGFSVKNSCGEQTINTYQYADGIHSLYFSQEHYSKDHLQYGDMCIASDHDCISYQEYWYRGGWFDSLGIYWRNFTQYGGLKNRTYEQKGNSDMATLCASAHLRPGERKCIKFVLTWNFPNCHNYWAPLEPNDTIPAQWKNYYATLFSTSLDSAQYSLNNWEQLYEQTACFKNTLFETTVEGYVLDAVSANLSVLKTATVLRLEDGSFYGWEGLNEHSGSCEGSCTHVWNYNYALPFLFPSLERSMRDLDFRYNQCENGEMRFRLPLPVGRKADYFRACADGHFGGVMKTYRDWKICGDDSWLRSHWTAIKKCISYAWDTTNQDRWDFNMDGVLEGRQHHTLDMELFGPNSWLEGYYLGALKAASEMAAHLGEMNIAREYRDLFEKGKAWTDKNLFNGCYYHQTIDLKDKSIVDLFGASEYWNDEAQEIKYQIADGCEIDQVSAQWHANICGLGDIFDKTQRKIALKNLYKNNYKKSMRNFYNPCRLYCLNDESGIVICDWPEGKKKPDVPLPYAEETQNGYEYQSGILMIQEGLVEEGLSIVKSIRNRYNGKKRNPWNEFECGSNYARSMASYSLLNAFSGFEFDMTKGMIGFHPVCKLEIEFRTFWSLADGWGQYYCNRNVMKLSVKYGRLALREFRSKRISLTKQYAILLGNERMNARIINGVIKFDTTINITVQKPLCIFIL